MSKNFDMVDMSHVGNLVEVSRDFRDIIPWAMQTAANLKSWTQGTRKHVNDAKCARASTKAEHRWHACGYLCVQDFRFSAI